MGFMFEFPFSRVEETPKQKPCATVAGLQLYPTRKPDKLKIFLPRDDSTSEHSKTEKGKGHLPEKETHVRVNV